MRTTAGESSRLRSDAQRNRERIVRAAHEAFAEQGIDVPMAAVARRAGVGVATLYRRFPTRRDLVQEVFADRLDACTTALDEGLADPDPWQGFRHVVEQVCRLQTADRGFTAAFLAAFPETAEDHAGKRHRGEHGFATLVRRAQAAGALRRDFHPSDLTVVLLANGSLATALPDPAAASRRLVAYLLDSFHTSPAGAPLPPPTGLGLGLLAP